MKQLVLTLLAIGAISTLSACHTIHGAGQDVSSVGEHISHAAR